MKNDQVLDLIIVGAGPAGISAAYAAEQLALDYVVLERDKIASTIMSYPLGKTIFSDGCDVEIIAGTLHASGPKPTREEVLNYYRRFAEDEHRLKIRTEEPVLSIAPGRPLRVTTERAEYRARAVLVVTGVGDANELGVPGATPDRVSHLYQEIELFRNRPVLVVGGGNSAGEAALDLLDAGAQVTLSLRRPSLDRTGASRGAALQPSVRRPLDQAINLSRLQLLYNSRVVEVLPSSARLVADGEELEVPCDRVFALLGTTPSSHLLSRAGAIIEPDGVARYDRATYETTVPNLYVAGHVTREINLLNAVRIPPRVVAKIAERLAEQRNAPESDIVVEPEPYAPVAPEPVVAPPYPTAEPEPAVAAAPVIAEPAPEPASTPEPEAQPAERQIHVGDDAVFDASLSAARVRQSVEDVLRIDGAVGIALANARTGEVLAAASRSDEFNVSLAASENCEVLRARQFLPEPLARANVEDIVITLGQQYHIMRMLDVDPDLFLYLVVDRNLGNLGLARYTLARADRHIAADAVEPPPDAISSSDVLRENRLPPGQSRTLKWPVVHFGAVPQFDRASWTFRIHGLVERECQWNYEDMMNLPTVTVLADFHCVTRWSRLNNLWEGISARHLLWLSQPVSSAQYAIVHAEGGWTTSLPLDALMDEDTLFAYRHNGVPLEAEHGFPLRLVVPKLYAWKSAKWVRAIEIVNQDKPGFWERAGYHAVGDPWQEQRRG